MAKEIERPTDACFVLTREDNCVFLRDHRRGNPTVILHFTAQQGRAVAKALERASSKQNPGSAEGIDLQGRSVSAAFAGSPQTATETE